MMMKCLKDGPFRVTTTGTHIFCILTETNIWSKINIPEIEDSPCPRRRHCCCILDEKAVLFGGTR